MDSFGVRFVDSIHRFNSIMRFVDSIHSFDSLLRQQPIDSTTRPGGMREAIKSAARPEGGGAERVRSPAKCPIQMPNLHILKHNMPILNLQIFKMQNLRPAG